MFMKKASVFVAATLVASSSGYNFDEVSLDEGDFLVNSQELGRTFGSFNLSAITGGVTIDGSTILKAGLIILLFKILYALALGRSFLGNFSNRAYDRVYQNRKDSYYYDDFPEDNFSSRKSDVIQEDLATLMHSLEQSFKKYSVHYAECKMYVACEAGQVERHEENGALAKTVYDIVSNIVDSRDINYSKMTAEMEGITQAFNYGRDQELLGAEDACKPLRRKCFELQNQKQQVKYF